MQSKKVHFLNHKKQKLSAIIDYPEATSLSECLTFAIFAHCFTCSKNLKAVATIAKALTSLKIAVFRFDFTGLGQSEGDFADTNFSSNVEDVIAGANFLKENYSAPSIIIGHSLGGSIILKATSHIPTIKAVGVIGAPANPEHVTHHFEEQKKSIVEQGESEIKLVGRNFTIKKQFLDDLKISSIDEDITRLKKPLLILHSPIDNTVGIENAAKIFELAKHPKSFVSLDKADHLLSNQSDALYAGEVIGSWVKKYLPLKEENLREEKLEKINQVSELVIENKKTDKYKTNLYLENFHYLADEPASLGGSNEGATPGSYLLASLGACTAITLRMYANRKRWDLAKTTIALDSHKADQTTIIDLQINFSGDLSREQKNRLLEIAHKCPVHKTLIGEVKINTSSN